ncbi:MAG: EAL domain-containing protein [Sulfuritalea sp.]|nr:EAL domain-containing protein [Sulfuritalea sp.]
MAAIGNKGTTSAGVGPELALNAAALGALLDLNELLHEASGDHAAMFERVCNRIAPHHPGSLFFIAETSAEGELSVRSAEGMGAAVLQGLTLHWPDDGVLEAFGVRAAACAMWRITRVAGSTLDAAWRDLFAALDAGELAMVRIAQDQPGQPGMVFGVFAVMRAELPAEEVNLLQHVARALRKSLALAGERQALRQENQRLRLSASVFEHAMEGVIIADAAQRIVAVNKAVTRLTGYDESELIGATPRLLSSGLHDADFYRGMWSALSEKGHWKGEIWNRRKNGEVYPELLSISAIHDESGEAGHYLGIFIDLTLQKEAEQRLSHLALHDPLTGLPNRESFRARIDRALRRGGRHAVLLLDIDRFKNVNDTFGHPEGDLLLKAATLRLLAALRPQDVLARLGGDEFALLMEDVTDRDEVVETARVLHQTLAAPFRAGNLEVGMTASIGVSLTPDDGTDASALLRHADAAMYEAKRAGGARSEFSVPAIGVEVRRKLEIESELRRAIERDELRLHYQAQVDLASGRIVGMEALLRWMKPGVGLIGPAHFIELAEVTGLIVPIGEWVLNEACRQCKAWQEAGQADLQVAVNLSARQLRDEGLADKVEAALRGAGLDPSCLELELTESVAVDSMEGGLVTLHRLRGMGVKLAVDDFGTGFSSLHYLKRLPIDRLKIEQSFVRGATSDRHDAAIVNAIVTLALTLGLEVVAEGVATEEQIAYLRRIGCHQAQGYYYGRPAPAEAILL